MTRTRIVATGAGAADVGAADGGAADGGWDGDDRAAPTDVVLTLAPQHPSAHGVLRLRLVLDGERIAVAEPIVGYMHRGAEKLFEARDYRQIIVLANRHDWLSAFSNELGVVLAVERMLGIQVPPRATWTRTLLAELNRVLSHLAFLGFVPPEPADAAPPTLAFRAREDIQGVMEELSGGRMHFMFNRVGGLKDDIPDGWTDRVRASVARVRGLLPELTAVITADAAFRDRARGVGTLTAEQVLQYGASGPVARASGVDFDLRRDEPYLAYGELDVPVAVRREGDCLARFECLAEQARGALDLADACLDRLVELPTGPVAVRVPKVLRAPEGHAYAWTENPLGINGYFLVSRGERTPWRMKLRSASFNNVQLLSEIVPGHRVADLTTVLGSLFFVVGDIDR